MENKFIISDVRQLPTLDYVSENAEVLDATESANALMAINRIFQQSLGIDMATTICDLVSKGETIRTIAEQIGIPTIMLLKWLKDNFPDQWESANEVRAYDLVEESVAGISTSTHFTLPVQKAIANIKLKAAALKLPQKKEISITTPGSAGIMFIQSNSSKEVIDLTPVDA